MARPRDLANILSSSGSVALDSELALVLLNTTEFSNSNAVTVDNIFSSSYINYLLVIRNTGGNEDVNFRLRSGGSDVANNYIRQDLTVSGATVSGGRSTSSTAITIGLNTNAGISTTYISGPFLSAPTAISSRTDSSYLSGFLRFDCDGHTASTSCDGFKLTPGGAGGITGTLRLYGYKN